MQTADLLILPHIPCILNFLTISNNSFDKLNGTFFDQFVALKEIIYSPDQQEILDHILIDKVGIKLTVKKNDDSDDDSDYDEAEDDESDDDDEDEDESDDDDDDDDDNESDDDDDEDDDESDDDDDEDDTSSDNLFKKD